MRTQRTRRRRHHLDPPWNTAPLWAVKIYEELRHLHDMLNLLLIEQETDNMTPETLETLRVAVAANTNEVQAATAALNGYAQSNADLTKALEDAIANSDAKDDPAVQEAVSAINANNAALKAAVPGMAAAIPANT